LADGTDRGHPARRSTSDQGTEQSRVVAGDDVDAAAAKPLSFLELIGVWRHDPEAGPVQRVDGRAPDRAGAEVSVHSTRCPTGLDHRTPRRAGKEDAARHFGRKLAHLGDQRGLEGSDDQVRSIWGGRRPQRRRQRPYRSWILQLEVEADVAAGSRRERIAEACRPSTVDLEGSKRGRIEIRHRAPLAGAGRHDLVVVDEKELQVSAGTDVHLGKVHPVPGCEHDRVEAILWREGARAAMGDEDHSPIGGWLRTIGFTEHRIHMDDMQALQWEGPS
jgi:hypothetical protein